MKTLNEIIDDRIKLCSSNLMIFDDRNNNVVRLMLEKLSSEISEIIDDNDNENKRHKQKAIDESIYDAQIRDKQRYIEMRLENAEVKAQNLLRVKRFNDAVKKQKAINDKIRKKRR